MYPQSFYLFKTFLRITRTTGFGKRYRISGISRESSRVHLLMLFFRCLVRAFFVLNTSPQPSIGHLNISLLTACVMVMCVPKLRKHLLQIGHFCGSSPMNSGASLLHCEHKSFQSALSCAVCAQILMSSFGKPVSTILACEMRFLRRPVLFCVRSFTKP